MVTRDSIESAYCFFHQKWTVYARSNMDWQRDDIEYAISSYVDGMNPQLYEQLSGGRQDFLRDHVTFSQDIQSALTQLERMQQQ